MKIFRKFGRACVIPTLKKSEFRFYSSTPCLNLAYIHDPEYGVQLEEAGDNIPPSKVRVPWLTEAQKDDIYSKHKSDPVKFSTRALSQLYKANEMRIMSVIFMRRERENYMQTNNLINFPAVWETMFWKYNDILEVNKTGATEEDFAKLAEEFKMTLEEVHVIIPRMRDHFTRKEEEDHHMSYYTEEVLPSFTELGVDITFRETTLVPPGSLTTTYYPKLFDDDQFEDMKEEMRKKLAYETKACMQIDHEYEKYLKKLKMTDYDKDVTGTAIGKPLRHKIAFVDLSQPVHVRKTTIIKRNGQFRTANPYEELMRSWRKKYAYINSALHPEVLLKYTDPDNDDAETRQRILDRCAKRKEMKLNKKLNKA